MTAILSHLRVLRTFARNALVRDMTFRWNFITQLITSALWMVLQLVFYVLIFSFTDELGEGTGWGKYQFFVFLATSMFIRGLMGMFVMPNAELFSEKIRKGDLDFVLLKPMDTQFLISFERVTWATVGQVLLGVGLLTYSLIRLEYEPSPLEWVLYPIYLLVGLAIMYSVMICLASSAVWMGRNQSMFNLWFYITIFTNYPMEIYSGPVGGAVRGFFTWFIPVLIAVNVPARFLAKPLEPGEWRLALIALAIAAACLFISRRVFYLALRSYRSASS